MIEYPKALYKDEDVHSGVFVIVADAQQEQERRAEGYGAALEVKRKPGRPKKDEHV